MQITLILFRFVNNILIICLIIRNNYPFLTPISEICILFFYKLHHEKTQLQRRTLILPQSFEKSAQTILNFNDSGSLLEISHRILLLLWMKRDQLFSELLGLEGEDTKHFFIWRTSLEFLMVP
jgi:hypothetical protein